MLQRIAQIVVIVLALALPSYAWAGPVGDALREAAEVADDLEENVEAAVERGVDNVKAAVGGAIRNVQAWIGAALEHAAEGDKQQARAHALAAQHELRKISDLLGLGLKPLTPQQIKAKAGKTAAFKKALAKLPSGEVLYTGSCKTPKYGHKCCPNGGTPCNGACCAKGSTCSDGTCSK